MIFDPFEVFYRKLYQRLCDEGRYIKGTTVDYLTPQEQEEFFAFACSLWDRIHIMLNESVDNFLDREL